MSRIKDYMQYLADNESPVVEDFSLLSIHIVENPVCPDAVIQKNSRDEDDT